MRAREQFMNRRGRTLFWLIYNTIVRSNNRLHSSLLFLTYSNPQQQLRCLVANVECPKEALEWFEILQDDLCEHDQPILRVSIYAYRVCSIATRIRNLMATADSDSTSSLAPSLLAESNAIESELLIWMRSETVSPQLAPQNLSILPIWNMYRTVHSKLQWHLLELFNFQAKILPSHLPGLNVQHRRQSSVLISRGWWRKS
jgi:hypothetical protein